MRSWIDIAVDILQKRGPMDIFALVDAALTVKPVRSRPRNFLGQQIFRLAKANRSGLAVKEYPSFRLKSSTRPEGFPTAGRLVAAYKILLLAREYIDLRLIVKKARSASALRSISDCPEYWMYEALTDKRFSHPFFQKRIFEPSHRETPRGGQVASRRDTYEATQPIVSDYSEHPRGQPGSSHSR